ncbi:MAG: phosphate signaling complex protein PhoU [Negativicutes bacterium]|nr:phosphate signaling complex protein PhoU [Negativicutes bacterium]
MRTKFDEQLDLLNTELIEMGLLIENAIQTTSIALLQKNVEEANKAISFEVEINEKERHIENLCLKLLLQQQPVARDLRFISAALKMITDMERIGDQARDISEIIVYLADEPYIKKIEHLPMMAAETIKMVNKSIDAFVKRDLALALEVMQMDDIVDELFDTIKRELIGIITIAPEKGGQALDLLMIAKYFERIGDHSVNIAEWVEFAITGDHRNNE